MRPSLQNFLWMAAGALVFLVPLLAVVLYQIEQDPAEQIALKARLLEAAGRMRLHLALASVAEKSAVMARTEQDSRAFAGEARAASAVVAGLQSELSQALEAGGTEKEKDALERFSGAFAELQRIENEVLDLAVRNTNLQAYSLAYGPAADALAGMDAALSSIEARAAAAADSADTKRVMLLASAARRGALRLQTLLPPHIAERSDEKMDALEALMAKEDGEVRASLDGLAKLLPAGSPDLEKAKSGHARFKEIEAEILRLSRENTNVRSLAISMDEKSKAAVKCQEALAALEQAIQEAPVARERYRPQGPR
jgi:hypothetical protein